MELPVDCFFTHHFETLSLFMIKLTVDYVIFTTIITMNPATWLMHLESFNSTSCTKFYNDIILTNDKEHTEQFYSCDIFSIKHLLRYFAIAILIYLSISSQTVFTTSSSKNMPTVVDSRDISRIFSFQFLWMNPRTFFLQTALYNKRFITPFTPSTALSLALNIATQGANQTWRYSFAL